MGPDAPRGMRAPEEGDEFEAEPGAEPAEADATATAKSEAPAAAKPGTEGEES